MSLAMLFASTLLAASPTSASAAKAPVDLDARRFELHIGGRAGLRSLDGVVGGGGVQIGLGVRLWQGLYFEAAVGEGLYAAPPQPSDAVAFRHAGSHADTQTRALAADSPAASALLVGQIVFGLRYEVRTAKTQRVRPSVFAGVSHLHEATVAEFIDAPGQALAGTGRFIRHRTGPQLGVGIRVPMPARWGRFAPHFSLRVDTDAAYYIDALPGRLQAGLGVGVQAVF